MELYRHYNQAMFGTALRLVNDRQRAEELMHDGFLEAFRKLDRFRGESTFGAWLKRIVINKCLDEVRRFSPEWVSWEDHAQDQESIQESVAEIPTVTRDMVTKAIADLPEGYRLVVSLYLIEGYDHDEIAGIMNISASTSRSQLARARQRLRTVLNHQLHVG